MFGISGFELLIIAVFVLVIFGPDKLPELARMFGKFMRQFKDAQNEMERVIRAEVLAPNRPKDAEEAEKPAVSSASASQAASAVWSATDEDDEEEDEE